MQDEDASEDPFGIDQEDLDWRKAMARGQLTEKQKEVAEKIRQREFKRDKANGEAEKLRRKERESGDGLRWVGGGAGYLKRKRRGGGAVCFPQLVST